MTRLPTLAALAATLLLAACSSTPDSESQQEARRGDDSRDAGSLFSTGNRSTGRAALAVPPDLLSSSSDQVRENQGDAGGSGYKVLPEIIGATIHTDQGRSWLEIAADAEVVWRKLAEFWAFEEIDLVEYKPEAGLMETDWFVKSKRTSQRGSVTSIAVELFEAFTSRLTAHDKFILRLERNDSGGTNLYVTHRSREKIGKEPGNKQDAVIFEWVERSQDPEKVAQLLQAIVLLFGSGSEKAEAPAETPA